MQAAIAKWGNSLALRLPRHVAEGAKLKEGAAVEVEVKDGTLVITPVRKKYKLSDLLAQMNESPKRGETDWGEPQGAEEW